MANNSNKNKCNVPHLRFPEFTGEWKNTSLGEIGKTFNGLTGKSSADFGQGFPYITYKSIFDDSKIDISRVEYVEITDVERKKKTQNEVQYGDVFFTTSSETPDEVGMSSVLLDKIKDCYLNSFCFGYRLNSLSETIPEYMRFYLRSQTIRKKMFVLAQGSTRFNISKSEVMGMSINIPEIEEQRKIANLLTLLDDRIATQNKIIKKYESLIKGIMVELQKQGLKKGTWKKVFLNDILTERNERNSNLYQVFSVSVSQGIINQVDHLGRSFSAKDTSKYNVVHYGDLVYTKSPTGSFPYGIVKQSLNRERVAVSPLYGVYVPNSLAIGVYLHKYFMSEINTHNYLHPLIQKGAKNTINITNQRFLENRVPMPLDSNELLLISKLLRSVNDKIRHEQNMLQEYQKQKQYLLRQMFI